MASRRPIPFFTDNDVADSVGDAILAAGHRLTRLRDCMLSTSPDDVVATNCREHGLVLVTHNYKDFRRILREEAALNRRAVNALCRVELRCKQFMAAERLKAELPHIEVEWERFQRDAAMPMCIEISDETVRLSRQRLAE